MHENQLRKSSYNSSRWARPLSLSLTRSLSLVCLYFDNMHDEDLEHLLASLQTLQWLHTWATHINPNTCWWALHRCQLPGSFPEMRSCDSFGIFPTEYKPLLCIHIKFLGTQQQTQVSYSWHWVKLWSMSLSTFHHQSRVIRPTEANIDRKQPVQHFILFPETLLLTYILFSRIICLCSCAFSEQRQRERNDTKGVRMTTLISMFTIWFKQTVRTSTSWKPSQTCVASESTLEDADQSWLLLEVMGKIQVLPIYIPQE